MGAGEARFQRQGEQRGVPLVEHDLPCCRRAQERGSLTGARRPPRCPLQAGLRSRLRQALCGRGVPLEAVSGALRAMLAPRAQQRSASGNCGTPAFVLEENREALEGELFARQPARELDKQATGAKRTASACSTRSGSSNRALNVGGVSIHWKSSGDSPTSRSSRSSSDVPQRFLSLLAAGGASRQRFRSRDQ